MAESLVESNESTYWIAFELLWREYFQWVAHAHSAVNACMNQLNTTGYMSNRGRQIVASCFVNELQLDWRYGAAHFEQQLVDYDVASNWGDWQYLAGVGMDPRGKRHFDIEKQTTIYVPDNIFIKKWSGKTDISAMDSADAADWPIINQVFAHSGVPVALGLAYLQWIDYSSFCAL